MTFSTSYRLPQSSELRAIGFCFSNFRSEAAYYQHLDNPALFSHVYPDPINNLGMKSTAFPSRTRPLTSHLPPPATYATTATYAAYAPTSPMIIINSFALINPKGGFEK